ncbi:hypothetical protein STENM327S_00346 [Streptomyces tendae]
MRLTGALDREALRQALADVVDRHESLRTVFAEEEGGFTQVILEPYEVASGFDIVVVDEERLGAQLAEAARYPFDLAAEPPLRATLFEVDDDEYVLLLLLHHIAGDGSSMRPLARDLATAYAARVRGAMPEWAPLPVQYADYSLWQRDILGTEDDPDSEISRQLDYWTHTLTGLPDQLELPYDRPRSEVVTQRGGQVSLRIPAELHAELHELARTTRSSLFMVFQAGLAALLTRLGAGTDIPLGSPIAGRTDAAVEELVGFFANTLVLRTDTSGNPTFAELVERVRTRSLEAYQHQDLPFERLVEAVNPDRSLTRHPLFQVCLTLHNTDPRATVAEEARLPGLTVELERLPIEDTKFDLNWELTEHVDGVGRPAGVTVDLEFSAELFDRGTARSVADRFVRLLSATARDAEVPIGEVDVLTPDERTAILDEWSDAARPPVAAALSGSSLPRTAEDTRAYVLDDSLAPVPPGVAGALYVTGSGPAGDAAEQERWLPCPFGRAGWMYRTGTSARWSADGELRLVEVPGRTPAGPADVWPARSRGPRSPREQILCTVFAELLGVASVGIDDDFFDRGGHSLSAVRLLSRIRAVLGVELSIRRLFENPTVAGVVEALDEASGARRPVTAVARPARIPLSYAQQRLWFLNHLEGPSATYNIPVALGLKGALDRAALRLALNDVVARHESLRTLFAQDSDGARQVVLPVGHATPELTEVEVAPGELQGRIRTAASIPSTSRPSSPSGPGSSPRTTGSGSWSSWSTTSPGTAGRWAPSPATCRSPTLPALAGTPPRGRRFPFSTPTTRCGSGRCSARRTTRAARSPGSWPTGRPRWRTFRRSWSCRSTGPARHGSRTAAAGCPSRCPPACTHGWPRCADDGHQPVHGDAGRPGHPAHPAGRGHRHPDRQSRGRPHRRGRRGPRLGSS